MEQISISAVRKKLKEQGVSSRHHYAFKCPTCGTIQSMALLIKEGCNPDKVENYIGFSCVGRFNNAGPPPSKDDKKNRDKIGCNWTLGGLFRLHKMEIIDDEGTAHPHFALATPEEAMELEISLISQENEVVA